MLENRKFWRIGEKRIQVDYGSDKNNNNYNHLLDLSPVLILASYRSTHQGPKNINVKKLVDEGNKVFIEAK